MFEIFKKNFFGRIVLSFLHSHVIYPFIFLFFLLTLSFAFFLKTVQYENKYAQELDFYLQHLTSFFFFAKLISTQKILRIIRTIGIVGKI